MWSSSFLILGLASAFVKAQNPPNLANSTVPYDLPKTQKYDYSEVLHKSLLFYHAQRSGALGSNRRLAWRGDSCFICTGPHGEDLSGGYYEAANTMVRLCYCCLGTLLTQMNRNGVFLLLTQSPNLRSTSMSSETP